MRNFSGITHHEYESRSCLRQFLMVILFFLSLTSCLVAQESEKITPQLLPIPLADIPSRAVNERTLLDQVEVLLARSTIFDEIEKDLLAEDQVITKGLISLRPSLTAASSLELISEIEKQWLALNKKMEETETALHERIGVIEQQISKLEASLDVWKKTGKEAQDVKAHEELIKLTHVTTEDIEKTYKALQQMQNRVLGLQGKVGRSSRGIQEALERIKSEKVNLLKNLGHRERPPLWSEAFADVSLQGLAQQVSNEIVKWWSSIFTIIRSEYDRIGFHIFLLISMAIILHRVRKITRHWMETDPSIATGLSVFERPNALAILLAVVLTPWLYVSTSPALADATGLLLLFPVLWLVLPLLNTYVRPALFFLAILYIVDWSRDLVEAAPLVARYIFIIEMITATSVIVWLSSTKALYGGKERQHEERWQGYAGLWLQIALFLLIISIIAAIAGFVRLSVLIGFGVLNSAYLAVLLVALVRTADAIVALILHSHFMQTINVIHLRSGKLREHIKRWLGVIAVFVWIFITLDMFALLDPIVAFLKGVLFAKLHAGAIIVSLADVLAFFVTILTAILISRLIILVLEEDIYPRVELGRGVSFAISSVIKYSIILLGFMLAVGAMGIGMDRITILLGAFGVGLGFGLQTVINNFVSGMILIFERPIQIGDSVEIGSVKGTIKRIGIRSSTVRSFEGADITVPNGSLLSDALTNWTMADRNRRIEIPVGVAYGSDPDKVIEALNSALSGQEGLLSEPAPQVIFKGFGDNSLDFTLRAWVEDNDAFVTIRSKVALAMNEALNEYGIEIPFPQRDLHLRSVSKDLKLNGAI